MAAPDLTLTLDPVELWPDPETCPDWPLYRDDYSRRMSGHRTPDDARQRLRGLGYHLNGDGPTRAPTDAERAEARGRFFADGAEINWQWPLLGLGHLCAASASVRDKAYAIVEAAHIRGYLRKLDTRAARMAGEREAARVSALRARADDAPGILSDLEGQLAEVEAGEARHLQRLADEADARRAHDLREQIAAVRFDAAQAAAQLSRNAAA